QYPMTFVHRGERVEIGTLTVIAGLDAIHRQLLRQALVILASNAVKTFLVAAFAFMFFHWLVNRHLLSIAGYVPGLVLHLPPPPLALAREGRRQSDELDEVVTAINLAHQDAAATFGALRESEARLRLAIDAANAGLWERDLRSDRIDFSPEYLRKIGC